MGKPLVHDRISTIVTKIKISPTQRNAPLHPEKKLSQRQAAVELVVTSAMWGFGFIATIWALEAIGALWVSSLRFFIAAIFMGASGILFSLVVNKRFPKSMNVKELNMSAAPGFFLAGTIVLQTKGLLYTTATNSGFITTLYVLFVPLVEMLCFKKKLHRVHGFLVAIALIGAALMCKLNLQQGLQGSALGDLLTLGAALFATAHIIMVGTVSKKTASVLTFNTLQTLWAALWATAFALYFEGSFEGVLRSLHDASPRVLLGGLGFLIFGSTIFAFAMQIRAQKVLPASLASMIFLLESPFAALLAFLLLGEKIDSLQAFGGVLILASAAFSVRLETKATS